MSDMVQCFACDKPANMQIEVGGVKNGACDDHTKQFWAKLRSNIRAGAKR